jgi:hypothetical protein
MHIQAENKFTKHYTETKDRVTRTPLKTEGDCRFSVRVNSSCSTSGNRRVNLAKKIATGLEILPLTSNFS